MAVTTIKVYRPYAPVLQWLQDNVGPLLHSNPIIFWHGRGWHMKFGSDVASRGQLGKYYCTVDIEDQQLAVLFTLKWT